MQVFCFRKQPPEKCAGLCGMDSFPVIKQEQEVLPFKNNNPSKG
jgi:hypothetical protein